MEEAGGPNALRTISAFPCHSFWISIHSSWTTGFTILDDFTPELVLNSAGQDNHFSDPLALCASHQGYARLNETAATGPLCPRGVRAGGSALSTPP